MLRARSLWIFAAVALIATATRLLLASRPEIAAAEQVADPLTPPVTEATTASAGSAPATVSPVAESQRPALTPGRETYLGLVRLPASAVFIHSSAVTASGKVIPHYGYLSAASARDLADYFDAEFRDQGWQREPSVATETLTFTRGDVRITVAIGDAGFLISGPWSP